MSDERLTMSISAVAKELGITKATAYKLAHEPGFPSIRIAEKRIVVHREKFIEWLDKKVGNVTIKEREG